MAVRPLIEAIHYMDVVPIAWLGVLRWRGVRRDHAWWWLAGTYLVAFLSDTAAHYLSPDDRWLPSLVYPVSQAAIIGAVFLDRMDAARLLSMLIMAGLLAVMFNNPNQPDVVLRAVTWGAATAIVWINVILPRLRVALLVSYGLALLAWIAFMLSWALLGRMAPLTFKFGWTYHGIRALGLVLFCWAAMQTSALKLARARV